MSTERNKQVVRRLYDVVNSGDIETLNELAVLDYDEHDPLPGQATGRQGLADRVTILRTAFAPQFTIEDVIAEHDKVVVRWTNETTHIGEFLGVPATRRARHDRRDRHLPPARWTAGRALARRGPSALAGPSRAAIDPNGDPTLTRRFHRSLIIPVDTA